MAFRRKEEVISHKCYDLYILGREIFTTFRSDYEYHFAFERVMLSTRSSEILVVNI